MQNAFQWIVRFTRFKATPQEGGKGLGISRTDGNRKIDVLGSSWNSPR